MKLIHQNFPQTVLARTQAVTYIDPTISTVTCHHFTCCNYSNKQSADYDVLHEKVSVRLAVTAAIMWYDMVWFIVI